VSIQVVAGPDTREFALAALDFRILCARSSRDYHQALADQSVVDDTPIMECYARGRAQAAADTLDRLLENRHTVQEAPCICGEPDGTAHGISGWKS